MILKIFTVAYIEQKGTGWLDEAHQKLPLGFWICCKHKSPTESWCSGKGSCFLKPMPLQLPFLAGYQVYLNLAFAQIYRICQKSFVGI